MTVKFKFRTYFVRSNGQRVDLEWDERRFDTREDAQAFADFCAVVSASLAKEDDPAFDGVFNAEVQEDAS